MKVEFFSKYGIVAEFAKLTETVCITLAAGEFADAKSWGWLDAVAPEEDSDPLIGSMLVLEGMAIAQFESMADAHIWLTNVQERLDIDPVRERAPSLLTIVFDRNGNPISEGNITQIQLPQEVTNEPEQ